MPKSATKSLQDIDVLIAQVSSVTGLSRDQISAQMASSQVNSFRLNDMILVSPEDFDSIIDAWAETIKASLRTGKQVSQTAPIETEDHEDEVIDLRSDVKPKGTRKKATNLSWPKGYESQVTHLYSPTLKKILPEDKEQRRLYLEAIATETPAGKKLGEELATAIVKRSKRKLAKDKVLDGLKAKCAEML